MDIMVGLSRISSTSKQCVIRQLRWRLDLIKSENNSSFASSITVPLQIFRQ